MTIQALTNDELYKFVDEVKEVIEEAFDRVTQKKEEMNLDVQAQMVAL
jgi:hypothetical protein